MSGTLLSVRSRLGAVAAVPQRPTSWAYLIFAVLDVGYKIWRIIPSSSLPLTASGQVVATAAPRSCCEHGPWPVHQQQ